MKQTNYFLLSFLLCGGRARSSAADSEAPVREGCAPTVFQIDRTSEFGNRIGRRALTQFPTRLGAYFNSNDPDLRN